MVLVLQGKDERWEVGSCYTAKRQHSAASSYAAHILRCINSNARLDELGNGNLRTTRTTVTGKEIGSTSETSLVHFAILSHAERKRAYVDS